MEEIISMNEQMKSDKYSSKELNEYIKNKYPEVEFESREFFRILTRHYKKYIHSFDRKVYVDKDIVEKIDFNYINYLKTYSGDRTFKQTIDLFLRNGYLVATASKIMGVDSNSMRKILREGKYLKYTDETLKLVNRDEVEYWVKFRENHSSLYDIYNDIEKEVGKKYNPTDTLKYKTFYKMRTDGTLNQFNIIPAKDTCFLGDYGFVRKEIEDEVKKFIYNYLENVIVNTYGSKIDILDFYISKYYFNKNIRETLKHLSLYANDKISKTRSITQNRFILITNEIVKLNKELFNATDDEVSKILLTLNNKAAKEEYCRFLMYLKEVTKTRYSKNYQYDREASMDKNSNNVPYTMEQYLRFGFLCISDKHIWHDEYINKALSSRKYVSVWLYCIFHYICAWRSIDIINNLPKIELGMKPQEFLNKVRDEKIKDEILIDYVNQLKFKIDMLNIKPQKTQSKTTPNLVLEIPESIKVLVGTLLGIAEAQFELSNNYQKKGLIIKSVVDKKLQQEFFGEEFKNIFKDECFNNLRATKNYELLIAKNGEEQSVGTGYVLASIARSHKFFGDKKSETTKIYLEHFYKLESSEKILIELYERGVCSFVPYLLTKAIYGEENVINLDIEKQTKLIKDTISYDNYDTEIALKLYDRAIEKSKETISTMIAEYILKPIDEEELEKTLKNIAYNNAPSKNNNVGCIVIAQGKGCLYPKRENCFGCGYEIYLKSYLNELGKYINNIKKAAYTSKTEGSKRKNIMMIRDVLVPLTEEIFITLKTIYNISDLTEYKKLLK